MGLLLALSSPLFGGDRGEPAPRLAAARVAGELIEPALVDAATEHCRARFAHLALEACVEKVWTPRWRLEAAALERKLHRTPRFRFDERDLLHRALVTQLRAEAAEPSDIEVNNFLERHARDFRKPLRLRLFRILVATEDEARKLIAALPQPLSLESFRALAREHSVDSATNERGGDLGFVWPDGSTDVPQVHAEPELYAAALSLVDGAWSKEPVPEGDRFAILWRRGSLAPVSSPESARELARVRLREARAAAVVGELLSRLTEEKVRDRKDILLGKLRRKETGMFHDPGL